MNIKKLNTINIYKFVFLILVILSIITRFFNYRNRWGLAYDQAYDAIVAHYAFNNNLLPLLGRFSSAGPFQTGGEWFWIIMAGLSLNPYNILTPWIFLTVIYVLFVILIIFFGRELVDKKFSLIIGIITTFSTAQIAQGVNLTNQSPQAITALLALWFSIKFIRKQKIKYIFLSALLVGIASSIHLQGAALIILLFVTLLLSKNITTKTLLAALLGLLIPWFPVFMVDIQNNFINLSNMLQYYLIDQYKISLDVLGRRWLTFLGIFIPNSWALITGGWSYVLIFFPLSILYIFYKKRYKRISAEWLIIIVTFFLILILLRYTRTPLFESYLVFLHPFFLLISSGIIYALYKISKFLGVILLIIVISGSVLRTYNEITQASNLTYKKVSLVESELLKVYKKSKFEVYDYKYKQSSFSLPLVLSLYVNKFIDDKGVRIGIIDCSDKETKNLIIKVSYDSVCVVDLNKVTRYELIKRGWINTNPSVVYKETQEWYRDEN